MAEDAFKPQKRTISQEEIEGQDMESNSGDNASDQLAQMEQMRNNINKEVGNEIGNNPEAGIQIKGNVPEAFKNAVAQKRNQTNQQQPQSQYKQNDMRVTGSGKLEELIAGIGAKGSIIYEQVSLPSKGKFYDGENGPKDGIIHLRPMTGEEEEILATPRFVKKGQAINMIFDRCMRENYNSSNFLTQDRTYMLIYLRGISYTPEYDVEIKDPDSDQTFATTINLNELYVDYCPNDFDSESLVDELPVTGYKFRYRLATGSDEQSIQDYRERRAKNFDLSGQADDTLLFRTAHLIEEIEGLFDKLEIQTLLKKLPIQDVAYLRTVVNEPPFGVDTKINITNPYTMSDFEVELPLESNFFFPRAKRKKTTVSKTQV